MANDSSAASETAVSLIAAAVVASPPLPRDPLERQGWMAGVSDTAASLYRQAQTLDADIARLAQCRSIPGEIVRVEEVKRRGVITYRSEIGSPAHKAPDGTEQVRTRWLSEPQGAALFAQAQALVGRRCTIGKYIETKTDGSGHDVAMVAWIDAAAVPAGADGPTSGDNAASDAEPSVAYAALASGGAPVRSRAPSAPGPAPPPPEASSLDLSELRNLPMRNWDDLTVNAMNHFGVDANAVNGIGMEVCGAAGPRNANQYRRTWNAVVTKYHREAA